MDLSIAGYFLAQAIAGVLLNGFDALTCPVCVPGSLHYAAFPASLFVFSGFLLLMVRIAPKNATLAALFAVGTFDMVASSTSFLWGAPWYITGYSGPNLVIWLIMITIPVLISKVVPEKKALLSFGAVILITVLWQLSINFGPSLWFQWREENLIEAAFCVSAYFWFRPRGTNAASPEPA